MKVLIGKKIGMTQVFNKETGELTPVTAIDVSENFVSKVFKDGDKVTHVEIGKDKKKNPNSADLGNYKGLSFVPQFKEVFKTNDESNLPEEASELSVEIFENGDFVDVTGISKGKGFQGVMKRWNFKGGKRTHGQSDRERAPGSIGSGTTPGRVVKGKKMAGRMGREKNTVKNLKVMDLDTKNSIVLVTGAVPGYNGTYLIIKESFKNRKNK